MSAKEALEAILSDESLSADSMLSSALSTARTHRMGTSRLGKLLADRTDVPIPETVEEIVRELVSHSISQLTVNKLARDAIVEKTQGWTESPNEVTSGAVHFPSTGTRRPTVSSKISAAADHETASTSVSTQTQSTEHLDHSTQTPTELFREHEPLQKDLMKSILLLLEEFKKEKQAAADREDRLNRKIQALTNQVRDLSIAFDEERNSNCEREQRLAKLVNDMKCRLPKTPTTTVSSSTKIVDPPLSMEKSPALAAAAAHETSSRTPVLNKSREIADRIRVESSYLPQPQNPPVQTTQMEAEAQQPNKPPTNSEPNGTPEKSLPKADDKTTTHPEAKIAPPTSQAKSSSSFVDLSSPTWPTQDSFVGDGQWISSRRVSRVTSQKPTTPTPTKPLGKLCGAAREQKSAFFVGGISLHCTTEDLQGYITTHCSVIDCKLAPSRRLNTQSAHVIIARKDQETFQNIKWPDHVYCRPWHFSSSIGEKPQPPPRSSEQAN